MPDKDVSKYLTEGAIVPVDRETTTLLVDALREVIEKHQSCLHCGKRGHHHTNCIRTFVQKAYRKERNT